MEEGREILIHHDLYNQILLNGKYDEDLFGYSIVPLELKYIEEVRKDSRIDSDTLTRFTKNLAKISNHNREPLRYEDIADLLVNEEYLEEYLDKQNNPFKLAAVTVIESLFQYEWIDTSDLMTQFQKFYDK